MRAPMPNRLPPRPRNRTATLGLLLSFRYNPRRLIQVVDDHVLIAVVVEIGQRHAVRDPDVRKSPPLRGRFKLQAA